MTHLTLRGFENQHSEDDTNPNRMVSQKVVTPVKTGVQRDFNLLILLDTGCSLSRP